MRTLLNGLFKTILILHRYLGVVLGVVMTVWCLSGFVMMYQSFPGTTQQEVRAGLQQLDPATCCDLSHLKPDQKLDGFRIEMLLGKPVLRAGGGRGGRGAGGVIDLATGETLPDFTETDIRRIATDFTRGNAIKGEITSAKPIKVDQWSVGVWKREPVLWKVEFGAPSHEWLYVSGRSGQVVQDASGTERLISWFGAVPHWLYPTILRQDGPLWTQVVIWSSLVGVFLTVTGLVVGVVKLRGKSGKWWPYKRPMWLWHHMFGVFAGVLVLTWVFSGLMTMSPFGWFESEPTFKGEGLRGRIGAEEARAIVAAAPKAVAPGAELVQVRGAALLADNAGLAVMRDGSEVRYGPNGPAPLSFDVVKAQMAGAPAPLNAARLELLDHEDAYYYGHKDTVTLPVWRAVLNDADATRIYINPTTGETQVFDGTRQRYRWLDNGMHTLDLPFLRIRPVWDVVVLFLLAAVTVSCATGAWLSFTRIGRDAGRVKDWLGRVAAKKPPASSP
jgi:uncharacterized iron-regulated membrane protein